MASRTTGLWRPSLISALLLACGCANALPQQPATGWHRGGAHHRELHFDTHLPQDAAILTAPLRYTSAQWRPAEMLPALQPVNAGQRSRDDDSGQRLQNTARPTATGVKRPPRFRSGRSKHPDGGTFPDAHQRRFRR